MEYLLFATCLKFNIFDFLTSHNTLFRLFAVNKPLLLCWSFFCRTNFCKTRNYELRDQWNARIAWVTSTPIFKKVHDFALHHPNFL